MKKFLSYDTSKQSEVIPITDDILEVVKKSKVKNGTLFAYSMHTTLALTINETLESNLCLDIVDRLTEMVEDDGNKYRHSCADHPKQICKTDAVNGPSHMRQMLVNQNLVIDIENGKLSLGMFQDIGVIEFDGPRKDRKVLIKIIKD